MVKDSMSLKILVFPLSLVITVAMAVFFIKPAYSEMMSVRNSLKEKNIQLDNLQKQNQKLQKVKSKWESLVDEKILVATALPEEEDVDAYISEITSKASRSGISLANIKLAQKSETTSTAEAQPVYTCGSGSSSESMIQAGSSAQPPATGIAPPSGAAGMNEAGAVSDSAGSAGIAKSCLKTVGISLSATGSWEQLLDFFKYLEDMNRISNVEAVSLSAANQVQAQDQAPSDLLTADISAKAFFKEKAKSGNAALAGSLASQEDFNRKALEKLRNAIYSSYDVPAVSPSGERNIFK